MPSNNKTTMSFDSRTANKLGSAEKAVVLHHLAFWINHNYRTNIPDCYRDKKWWTYQTYEQMLEYIPYCSIEKLRKIITRLEKKGIIESGQFHRNKTIRTKWYTIVDKEIYEWEGVCTANNPQPDNRPIPNGQKDSSNRTNGLMHIEDLKGKIHKEDYLPPSLRFPQDRSKDEGKEVGNNSFNKDKDKSPAHANGAEQPSTPVPYHTTKPCEMAEVNVIRTFTPASADQAVELFLMIMFDKTYKVNGMFDECSDPRIIWRSLWLMATSTEDKHERARHKYMWATPTQLKKHWEQVEAAATWYESNRYTADEFMSSHEQAWNKVERYWSKRIRKTRPGKP